MDRHGVVTEDGGDLTETGRNGGGDTCRRGMGLQQQRPLLHLPGQVGHTGTVLLDQPVQPRGVVVGPADQLVDPRAVAVGHEPAGEAVLLVRVEHRHVPLVVVDHAVADHGRDLVVALAEDGGSDVDGLVDTALGGVAATVDARSDVVELDAVPHSTVVEDADGARTRTGNIECRGSTSAPCGHGPPAAASPSGNL